MAEMSQPPIRAMVADYDELVAIIKSRRDELGLSQLDVDDVAGLPQGYLSHVEQPRTSRYHRVMGALSLPLILGALGLRLAVIEDQPPAAAVTIASMKRRRRKAA